MTHIELRAAMKALGYSVHELAGALGLAPSTIRQMMTPPDRARHKPISLRTERHLALLMKQRRKR